MLPKLGLPVNGIWLLQSPSPIGRAVSQNDKISKGLKNIVESNKLQIWLVFAIQTLIDIFHIMRDQTGRSLAEVRLTAGKHKEIINRYHEFLGDRNPYQVISQFHCHLNNIRSFINQWVEEDKIGNFRAKEFPALKRRMDFGF